MPDLSQLSPAPLALLRTCILPHAAASVNPAGGSAWGAGNKKAKPGKQRSAPPLPAGALSKRGGEEIHLRGTLREQSAAQRGERVFTACCPA